MTKIDWAEECGVFGVYDTSLQREDAARLTYFGLFALQHRGQEAAGIAVNQRGKIHCQKDQGLVVEVFDEFSFQNLKGHGAVGHVRYPATSEGGLDAIQPLKIKARSGQLALSLNGAITNAAPLREQLKQEGAIFQSNADFEVLLTLLVKNRMLTDSVEEAIEALMKQVQGAYAMVVLTNSKLIGVRDPLGIRPLLLGKLDDTYVLASESCALEAVGAEFVRDIRPGEIISISQEGISSRLLSPELSPDKGRLCIFEFVYFARPDSIMDGASVQESRIAAGEQLALEAPCDCDLVVGTPDSGLAAAMGYAKASGIPYGAALLKNRYVARTFAQPTKLQQELAVKLKFSVLKSAVVGKRILLVDDSIVRGTTTRHLIALLRNAGAKEVHMRVASPPICYPCYYGVSTPAQKELSASDTSVKDMTQNLLADSLAFLSLEGLKSSTKGIQIDHCCACFDGNFPAGVPEKSPEKVHKIQW